MGPRMRFLTSLELQRSFHDRSFLLFFVPYFIALHWLLSWVIMAWCEPEEFPYIYFSCHICHPLPRGHWSCSLSMRPLLDKAGSLYNIESTWIPGDLFDVCGTQDSFPHRRNFSQVKICLSENLFTNRVILVGYLKEDAAAHICCSTHTFE